MLVCGGVRWRAPILEIVLNSPYVIDSKWRVIDSKWRQSTDFVGCLATGLHGGTRAVRLVGTSPILYAKVQVQRDCPWRETGQLYLMKFLEGSYGGPPSAAEFSPLKAEIGVERA